MIFIKILQKKCIYLKYNNNNLILDQYLLPLNHIFLTNIHVIDKNHDKQHSLYSQICFNVFY